MKYALLLLAVVGPAHAGDLYVDVGLGYMSGSPLVEGAAKAYIPPGSPPPDRRLEEAPGPDATIEVGYAIGPASIFASHASSLSTGKDKGVNFVGVKCRFSVRVP